MKRLSTFALGLLLCLASSASADEEKTHGGMQHGKMEGGRSGMQHGHDMHARMQALHDHSKMMEGMTDQTQLVEEMKKHMRMMDEMMDEMMRSHVASKPH